jgi:hypothetical protein
MAIIIVCPGCKTRLTLGDDRAGETFECPKCPEMITVPILSPPGPPSSSYVGGASIKNAYMTGIVVAWVFGGISLLWSSVVLLTFLLFGHRSLEGAEAVFWQVRTLLNLSALFMSLCIVADGLILIGASLSYLRHPNGDHIVRVTSMAMLLATAGSSAIAFALLASSRFGEYLVYYQFRDSFLIKTFGSVIGVGIGTVVYCTVLMMLFHPKSRMRLVLLFPLESQLVL